jgi:uncharacterized membrane protein YsdA (DUF1294 family)/cold shock CspA family protein
MRFDGLIKSWNDDRGCGFIEPAKGGDEIYVHITAFPARAGRPAPKQRVSFEIEVDQHQKKRATKVELAPLRGRPRSRGTRRGARWEGAGLFAVPAFLLLYLGVAVAWGVPRGVALAYALASALCFALYAADKSAVRSGARRVPERTLLASGLVGGWPGGVLARQILHHKTTFRTSFWLAALVNVVAFVALSSPWFGAWHWLR